jgi:hypothetical protein
MDTDRMSTADMLQYCDEALAWDQFGPVDIFFFESVKKILLGQCSAIEEPDKTIDDLMGIERPVRDDELAPDYDKYEDLYYDEDDDDNSGEYEKNPADTAFDSTLFNDGFFITYDKDKKSDDAENKSESNNTEGFTVNM